MPDVKIKAQVYKDPRPAEVFDPHHARVRDHPPEWVYEAVRVITVSTALTVFRAQGYGSENVPNGPVIIAPNHASYLDHFFTGAFIRRHVQFMAKSQMFGKNPMSWVYNHGGVFPVRRGHADEESFKTAFQILERGGAIGMYVEGGRSRTGQVGIEAKGGIGRLALESGAPVVPVAILGSHKVRNWKRGQFTKVVVRYGRPVRWEPTPHSTRDQHQQVADEILTRIRTMHDQLEAAGSGAARAARDAVAAERTTARSAG